MEEATEPTVFVDSKGSNDMTVYNTAWYSLPADGVDQGLRCFKPNRPTSGTKGYNSNNPDYGYSKISLSGSGIDYDSGNEDGEDKVNCYRNWLGLMKGDLTANMEKNGKKFVRKLNKDRTYTSKYGKKIT